MYIERSRSAMAIMVLVLGGLLAAPMLFQGEAEARQKPLACDLPRTHPKLAAAREAAYNEESAYAHDSVSITHPASSTWRLTDDDAPIPDLEGSYTLPMAEKQTFLKRRGWIFRRTDSYVEPGIWSPARDRGWPSSSERVVMVYGTLHNADGDLVGKIRTQIGMKRMKITPVR